MGLDVTKLAKAQAIIDSKNTVVEKAGVKANEYVSLTVRCDPELVEAFRLAAAEESRSITGQVVHLMKTWVKTR